MLAFQVRTAYHRQVLHYDEAYYLCEARGLRILIQSAPDLLVHKKSFTEWKNATRRKGAILPPGNGKPSFILFLAIVTLLPIPEACAGDMLTIAGCLAGIICIFFLCRELGNSICEALALSWLFFISPIWNYYCVTTFANPLSAAILLGGILCYVKKEWFWTSLLFGVAFTVHYSAITVVGILLCAMGLELWLQARAGRIQTFELITYVSALAFPFLVWQALYLAARALTKNYLPDVVYRTYWEQLTYNYGRVESAISITLIQAIHRNLNIFSNLAQTETWPLAGVLSISPFIVLFLWQKLSIRERALGVAALTVPTFWLMNPGTVVSRVVLTFLPLLYISLILVISKWDLLHRLNQSWRALLFFVLMAFSLNKSIKDGLLLESPFRVAALYLRQQHFIGQVADTNCWPIWQLYEGIRMKFRPETSGTDIYHLQRLMMNAIPENNPPRIPIIIYNGQPVGRKADEEAFSQRLFTLRPTARWSMPYAKIPIFATEETDAATGDGGDLRDSVALYWIDQFSMRRLFPG